MITQRQPTLQCTQEQLDSMRASIPIIQKFLNGENIEQQLVDESWVAMESFPFVYDAKSMRVAP